MQTCEQHDNCIVVYDSPNCPVCDKIDDYEADISTKDEEIKSLENKLAEPHYLDGMD